MKGLLKIICILAFSGTLTPAWGAVDYFPVTIDGSFNVYKSVTGTWAEGYANNGVGSFRLSKANHHMGFMDWDGSIGAISGLGLGEFIASNGGQVRSAFLYVRAATDSGLQNTAAIITLRTANNGNIVEDAGSCCAMAGSPNPGIAGSSQAAAFRMREPPYRFIGDGIAEAWKRPSTGTFLDGFRPGDEVKFLKITDETGWDDETQGYRWALEYVIGSAGYRHLNTPQRFEMAGQLVNKDANGNFLTIGPANYAGTEDPLNLDGDSTAAGWYKVEINPDIILDIAFNHENKGLVFWNWIAGIPDSYANDEVYSRESQSGIWAPYLAVEVVPEPASLAMILLGCTAALPKAGRRSRSHKNTTRQTGA